MTTRICASAVCDRDDALYFRMQSGQCCEAFFHHPVDICAGEVFAYIGDDREMCSTSPSEDVLIRNDARRILHAKNLVNTGAL